MAINMSTRILLADENQIVRQELRALLEREPDFTVVGEANTGEAAVKLASEVKPDVVILDLAAARLQELTPIHQLMGAVPGAKVIGLSMHTDRRIILEVLKAGAIGYVLKEHAFEELAMAIRAVTAHKTYISHYLCSTVIQDFIDLWRDSEARFRTIFGSSSIGIALVDEERRIVESNPALQELLGCSQDELRHKEFTEFLKPEEVDRCKAFFKDVVAGNRGPYQVEKEYRRQDGHLSRGRLSVSPVRGTGSEGLVAIGMLEDINDQKQAAARICDDQEKLGSVAQELPLTEAREQQRLATDREDHVEQSLPLAQIKSGALASDANSLIAPVYEDRQLLEQSITSFRSLGFELSPPILYELGFEYAMEWLAEQTQEQHGVQITVEADRSPKPLNDEVRVLLLHLMQELLANRVKRAKPNKVAVLISRIDANLRLTIENDGREADLGAESPWSSPDDLRVLSLKERLQYLGGSLEVELVPGHGTLMSLMVPLMEKPTKKAVAKLENRVEERIAERVKPDESRLDEISQQRLAEETLRESEELYHRLLELFPAALVIYSEGSIVYVNPAGLRLFGAESPTQIIGKSISDVVHPDYRQIMQDQASLVEKGLETIPLQEKKFLRLDGEAIAVEIVGISITYLRKPAAQIIVKDISERIKTENALRESEQRLANFIDFLPDATLAIDREGKVIAWNKAVEEMTGIKAKNMLGKDNYEYALPFYGERRPILIDLALKPEDEISIYPEVKREGLSLAAETYFPMATGSEAYLYEKASILRDSKGNIIGAIESIRNITGRLKPEAEHLRFSKVESLGTLAGGIAQDFNTILAAIQENIGQAMSDGKLEPKVRGRLARAEKACLQAQNLSQELLTFAQGKTPNKKPVSIANLLKESAIQTLSGSKSRCEAFIPDDIWLVEADEGQINQVIGNLLVNADQAMPEGGVIKIRAENILAEGEPDLPIAKGKYAKLTFADEGGGISPEHLDKIFDPYFSDNQKGSGLGLAMAYSIIKNHSGYVKVESQVGVGTIFHIYLPATENRTPADEQETAKLATG
jgi:PAS domain S-box-containing protein